MHLNDTGSLPKCLQHFIKIWRIAVNLSASAIASTCELTILSLATNCRRDPLTFSFDMTAVSLAFEMLTPLLINL